jgi:mono/diheme cytochrome c family protein
VHHRCLAASALKPAIPTQPPAAAVRDNRHLEADLIKTAVWIVVALAVVGSSAVALSYTGAYDVAADEPHWRITARALDVIRERSIAVRAESLQAPNLADPALIALGAEHYAGMCTGCHLAPGMSDSEMRQGLYPRPPNLTLARARSPAESFWIIKHGIKMSAMPAWGNTHDDETIWAIVAFLQQLPTLDAQAYVALAGVPGAADGDHDSDDHDHDHNASSYDVPANPAAADPGAPTMGQPAAMPHMHKHASGG